MKRQFTQTLGVVEGMDHPAPALQVTTLGDDAPIFIDQTDATIMIPRENLHDFISLLMLLAEPSEFEDGDDDDDPDPGSDEEVPLPPLADVARGTPRYTAEPIPILRTG